MEIFQHPIQICHQIILRLHSSSHTREKVSINLTMKKSLSRQRRRASTQQKAAIRDFFIILHILHNFAHFAQFFTLWLLALLCLFLPVLLCAALVWCPCVLGVTLGQIDPRPFDCCYMYMYTSGFGPAKPFFLGKSYGLLKVINID